MAVEHICLLRPSWQKGSFTPTSICQMKGSTERNNFFHGSDRWKWLLVIWCFSLSTIKVCFFCCIQSFLLLYTFSVKCKSPMWWGLCATCLHIWAMDLLLCVLCTLPWKVPAIRRKFTGWEPPPKAFIWFQVQAALYANDVCGFQFQWGTSVSIFLWLVSILVLFFPYTKVHLPLLQ